MSRLLFIAVVAAIASIAYATNPSCRCREGIACTNTLENCTIRNYTTVIEGQTSNHDCGTAGNKFYFSCLESPNVCLYTQNCSQPYPNCQCRKDIKCYTSVQACRAYTGAITPESGNAEDCVAIGRPVFACWEEPDVCRKSDTCEVIIPGGGNQDPHFVGFNGAQYYFEGQAGQDYNILSDTSLQINAHFIRLNQLKGTYMGRVGVRFGEFSLTFDPNFGVFFNNTLMTDAEVETSDGSFLVETLDGRLRFTFQSAIYHFTASVAVEKGEKASAYINIKAAIVGIPERPHGILGQTARVAIPGADALPNPFHVEGAEADYYLRDGILGTDFTYNRFVPYEQPVTVTASRFRRGAVAALFEASAK